MTNEEQKSKIAQRKETLITFAILIAALVSAFLISSYVAAIGFINGASMEKTLYDKDIIIIWKLDKEIRRGEIVVCKLPELTRGTIVKRVAACPGDRVRITETGSVYVNSVLIAEATEGEYEERELEVPAGEYFLIGDNLDYSVDSRDPSFGTVDRESIEGKVKYRLFPKINKY